MERQRENELKRMHNSHFILHFFQRLASQVWRHRIFVALLIVVAIFATEFYALKLPKANAAYTIANSARFISGNSDYLSRTFSAGNRKTFTFSAWIKRGAVDTGEFMLLNNRVDASNQGYFRFTGNMFSFTSDESGGALEAAVNTTAVYRDPAAWQHFVGAVDPTQAVAADRVKMWVDGVQVTSFRTATYPAQNSDVYLNNAVAHVIGRNNGAAGSYFDGYLSDAYFIDGSALAPLCFGETDSNGYWRPKTYSTSACVAYGTNGFHLPLMGTSTAAGIGIDTSGNGN